MHQSIHCTNPRRKRTKSDHLGIAEDLIRLGQLFRSHWSEIQERVRIQPEKVERAATLGSELMMALVQERAAPCWILRATWAAKP